MRARRRRARIRPRSPDPRLRSQRSSSRPASSARGRSRSWWMSPRCSRRSRCRAGRRVVIVTNAGGLGILCADACEAAGLELVVARGDDARDSRAFTPAEASLANPVDLLGSATAETYARASAHDRGRRGRRRGHRPLRARRERRRGRGGRHHQRRAHRSRKALGARDPRRRARLRARSRTPSPQRGRSAERRGGRNGCAGPRGPCRRSTGSTTPRPKR